MKYQKNIMYFCLIFGLVLTGLVSISTVLAPSEDSATGTVTVGNSTPVAVADGVVDAAYATATSITPDDTTIGGLNATITDSNQLSDLKNVTFFLYDNSIHSGDFESATPDGLQLTTFTWIEATDVWSINQGSLTQYTMQTPQDPGTGSGATSYTFTARFDASKVSRADTDWRFSVRVYDDAEATDLDSFVTDFEMNQYFELSWSSTTFLWGPGGSVSSSSTNNTMDANRTISIIANYNWELRINASDMTSSGETDVDLDIVNAVVWDDDGVEGGTESLWVRNTYTIATGTWDNQPALSSEAAITRTVNIWFTDTGDFTVNKPYDAIVFIEVRANT